MINHSTAPRGYALILILSALLIIFSSGAWMLSHSQKSGKVADARTDLIQEKMRVERALELAKQHIEADFARLRGQEYSATSLPGAPNFDAGFANLFNTETDRMNFLQNRISQTPLGNPTYPIFSAPTDWQEVRDLDNNVIAGIQVRVTYSSPSFLSMVNADGYREFEVLYNYLIEARTSGNTKVMALAEGEARLFLSEPPFSRWAEFQMTGNWIAGRTSSTPGGSIWRSAPVNYFGRVHYGNGFPEDGPLPITLGGEINFLQGFTFENHSFTLRSENTELWANANQYYSGKPKVTWPGGSKPSTCANPSGVSLDACQESISLPTRKPPFSLIALGLTVNPDRPTDPTWDEQVSNALSQYAFKGSQTVPPTGSLPPGIFLPINSSANRAMGVVVNGDVDRLTSAVKPANQISALSGRGLQDCPVQEIRIQMENLDAATLFLPSEECRRTNSAAGSRIFFQRKNDSGISFDSEAPSNLILHVQGKIDKLGAPKTQNPKDQLPFLAANTRMTISAAGMIRIFNHMAYADAKFSKVDRASETPVCETWAMCEKQREDLYSLSDILNPTNNLGDLSDPDDPVPQLSHNSFPVLPESSKTILGLASGTGSITIRTEGYENHRAGLTNLVTEVARNPYGSGTYTQQRHPDDAPNNINVHANVFAVHKPLLPRDADYPTNPQDNARNDPYFGKVRAEGFGPETTDHQTIWKTGSKLRTDLKFRQKIKLLGSIVQYKPLWYGNAGLDGFRSQHAFDRRLQAEGTRLAYSPPGWPRRENVIYQQVLLGSGVKIRWMDDLVSQR